MHGIDVGNHISHKLQFVQQEHHFVRLVLEVYLTSIVVPVQSLANLSLLKLKCDFVSFV
jgi:hypothetical protein